MATNLAGWQPLGAPRGGLSSPRGGGGGNGGGMGGGGSQSSQDQGQLALVDWCVLFMNLWIGVLAEGVLG